MNCVSFESSKPESLALALSIVLSVCVIDLFYVTYVGFRSPAAIFTGSRSHSQGGHLTSPHPSQFLQRLLPLFRTR